MYDEPEYDGPEESPAERPSSPADRAADRFDEFRRQAELVAVFEGCRKFDAGIVPGLDAGVGREVQRGIGRLEKSWEAGGPFLLASASADAAALLAMPDAGALSTNDYHVHRRPGEVMVVRWLVGDQVATFYDRLQAHFDVARDGYVEDQEQDLQWKPDEAVRATLVALKAIEGRMAVRAHRDAIRQLKRFTLATQTADEMNIAHLANAVMGVPAADLVGARSAPPADPTDRDLAWFFKLFLLRGVDAAGAERMCCFTYLQKSDDDEF